MAALSRKEYLKRYMSGSNDKKKKKKATKPTHPARCKIVDDDVDLTDLPANPEADLEPERGEDAPLVAEVIDERPAELRVEEEYRKNTKWKTLGADSDDNSNIDSSNEIKKEASQGRHDVGSDKSLPNQRHDSDSDHSPHRVPRHDSDSDQSPCRIQRHDSDSDPDLSQVSRMHKADDQLPSKKKRHDSGSDQSPVRRKRHDSGSEQSPPRSRRQESGSDQSPPRRKKGTSADHSLPRRKRHNSDQSPPRRKTYKTDQSPRQKCTVSPNSDQSPPRRGAVRGASGQSPPRKEKGHRRKDQTPPRKGKTRWGSNQSPPSKSSKTDAPGDKRPEKMLEGKRAGLQDGKTLRKESEDFRRRERDAFQNIDDELSGRTASTILRDRATGRKRNLKAEHLLQKAEDAKKVEREEKYMQWGKGLKQQELQEGRLANDLYEMTKPLARYKDDVDLDRELRQQDRDGDPMLEFIKKKKAANSDPNKPVYRGPPPPPNRFGILPGYRWDGVDRSNGFEAERIARAAEKKASLEDAYKWSVECM